MNTATATTTSWMVLLCLAGATSAKADPFSVATTLVTSGTLSCHSTLPCSGEGTNAITIGTGANAGVLTFLGVNTTFEVTNRAREVLLGEFELTAPPGWAFPATANPNASVLRFALNYAHIEPVAQTGTKFLRFGPGGQPYLPILAGASTFTLPLGPAPPGYTAIVYTIRPFPFSLGPGTTRVTAQVGAVPEPATLVLLGTGLAGAALARRRKRAQA